jgi:hypothetical protein
MSSASLTFATKQTYCDRLNHPPITCEQARSIASAHFNQSLVAFSELSDGFFNATYRLDLADGAVRMLKVALQPVPVSDHGHRMHLPPDMRPTTRKTGRGAYRRQNWKS